jgi:hypothetical protein
VCVCVCVYVYTLTIVIPKTSIENFVFQTPLSYSTSVIIKNLTKWS